MPRVIDPICSQCHVPGGLAQAAPFKVTSGNPAATAASAVKEVNPADPTHSKLIEKPLGNLGHGGGQRFQPGSPEAQILLHWIALVTAPGCDLGGPGGGGGSGGAGADLYAANCASCHGADARGLDGRPDIRCNRSIHDVVLSGRTGPSGTMPRFVMTDAEIALVQAYLVGLCPIGGTGGADLFASNCASCHGIDATGSATAPSVRCATRVMDAVQYGRGERMPSLPALAPSEVTAVQSWLDGLCTASGRQASDLYAGNCSTCHGAGATGGQNGLGVRGPDIHCNREIAAPVVSGQGTDMPAFPALGGSDVTSLQQYLETTFCRWGRRPAPTSTRATARAATGRKPPARTPRPASAVRRWSPTRCGRGAVRACPASRRSSRLRSRASRAT
jgi:mono/diheme cytochrome c family protein